MTVASPRRLVPTLSDNLFVSRGGEAALQIERVDTMPPFLMSVVSPADHWLFVSSTGGLTLGRVQADRALLPYETDDRIHASAGTTGSVSAFRVNGVTWRPFNGELFNAARRRNLYKCPLGTWVELEEVADDLALTYRCRWQASERYGFVRTVGLSRHGDAGPVKVELVDGLIDVLPAGVTVPLLQQMSTLVDAYKRAELCGDVALFTLEAQITDHTLATESLHANAVWSHGLGSAQVCLSPHGLRDFLRGETRQHPATVVGQRTAYLLRKTVNLESGAERVWRVLADVHLDHGRVEQLRLDIASPSLGEDIAASVAQTHAKLRRIIASADGLSCGGDRRADTSHFANTLFNSMRGGLFADDGRVQRSDVQRFVAQRNHPKAQLHRDWLKAAPETMTRSQLLASAESTGSADLRRLSLEYLPLYFSRRHGDPSRPWNHFSIRLTDAQGRARLAYEGNWRDIFQNWEALCSSYPEYLPSIWAKFLNASTVDGFNPYRINEQGIDWEVPEPDNPWSNIGYWGDHQIAYLLRLLEASARHEPNALRRMLHERVFSYGAVPYRLAPYASLLDDPKASISFDWEAHHRIEARVAELGADGRLVCDDSGAVIHVTLGEKLLVPALSKLSNWVPDGGIWLNTQRPEWNDANNALAGWGLSVVTLCYLRKYLRFCQTLFDGAGELSVSVPVAAWFERVAQTFEQEQLPPEGEFVGASRRAAIVAALGEAYCDYRRQVYDGLDTTQRGLTSAAVCAALERALLWIDHTLTVNRRADGLAHAYNVMAPGPGGLEVMHLPLMLEGQVALLNSGLLDSQHVSALIDKLYDSGLYRPDQRSFVLYPIRQLSSFMDKNRVPEAAYEAGGLIQRLVDHQRADFVHRDGGGQLRFAASLDSAQALDAALDRLATEAGWREPVALGRREVHDVYEAVFKHSSFTGRSGTMHKYEGIGCIYWHMVAKLLLAVQEAAYRAVEQGESANIVRTLVAQYYRLREGLGQSRSAESFGAFPTDPYSHSPLHLGAQQPGMTGQVKEGVLCRQGELGWRVRDGRLEFVPRLLRSLEFLTHPTEWRFVAPSGQAQCLTLAAGQLAFTVCQTPVVYHLVDAQEPRHRVYFADGAVDEGDGAVISAAVSAAIFSRDGAVTRLEVDVPRREIAG